MMAAMGRKAGDMTLDKWQRMTEWFMTALALVFLFAYSWEVLARTHIVLCETVINIIWMAFIVDYVVSILLAKDKKAWFKENLLMLVSIALPIFRPLRLLRLVAVLNVLNRTGGMAVRGRITLYTCCSVTLLMYIGALAELDVERGVPGASITDFGEAIWWSFVTVTTVGYGDLSPVTWQGRSIAIGLMITGVALIGIVTATLASWIVDRVRDETDKRADEAESETEQLRHNVRELTDTVNQLRDDIARLRSFRFGRESELLGPIGIAVTQIEAGTQHNVVPDTCRFVVDVRTTDAYSNEETVGILRAALRSDAVPRSTRIRAAAVGGEHPLVKAAVAAGRETYVSPTTSDRTLMPFPALKMGPGQSSRSHTADEFVLLEEIAEGIAVYEKYIGKLAQEYGWKTLG